MTVHRGTNSSWALALLLWIPASVYGAVLFPDSATVGVGDSFSIPVKITAVSDLYAFQFDVSFDPATLQLGQVTEGAFLATGGATFFVAPTIDNLAGSATFVMNSLVGPGPGVSGSGDLAILHFGAAAPGSSPVTLSNIILLDSTLADLAIEIEAGQVDVEPVTAVPEPGTAILAGGLLLGFLISLRGRRQGSLLFPW